MNEKLPFRDVRADQPLSESDFAAIRKAVTDEVQAKEHSHGFRFLYPAIATAVAAILGIFGAVLTGPRQRPEPPIPVRPRAAAVRPVPAPAVVAAPAPQATVALAESSRRQPSPHRHHRKSDSTPLVASAEREPIVIQLQTSDPDIRILWIAR